MPLHKTEFTQYIRDFHFRELFNQMGWDKSNENTSISIDNHSYNLQSVAQKREFRVLVCSPDANGKIPSYATRKKIEMQIQKKFTEHFIIFQDAQKTEQVWQLVVRQKDKPTKITETHYNLNQDVERLFQRAAGVFFELDEEENITIVEVSKRIAENFHQNNEKVTKNFYDKFKKEHTSFLNFITGIDDKVNQDWYASLMLNRLMFCYFIQKKGFLDNNRTYLSDKLKACQENKGENQFYSFYRSFLLSLFHQGLGSPNHSQALQTEIGKIPYLNGGLFEVHELESTYPNIDINDKAFERVFAFFDQYEWHLDTRTTATGKDINPDVIGYIFEKYINDRANMGAYYTKEDITDYISKNCILPYLFEETQRKYATAFLQEGEIWTMLRESGSTYIYDALKKGVELSLPDEIAEGIENVELRTEWNKVASSEYALPTEIWREVVERRKRYAEVQAKITQGEIQHINDFITYNLNIRQFVQDVIEGTNDADFLRHFYHALTKVTIIDPTCGSGAFLFAAMNILESLYEGCIMRMRAFVQDEDHQNSTEKKAFRNKFKEFRTILENIQSEHHPNLQYFIYKSIILRNLYGVDIMKEATEIAKLRLFLKLVATVDADYNKPNLGLEPLPDIDFNIRAGNTLVGFATEEELQKGLTWQMNFDNEKEKIVEKCDMVARTFKHYKEIQLGDGENYLAFKQAKEELNTRLRELNHDLNVLLHKQNNAIPYQDWLKSHFPFHWFAEFYEIIKENKGFDVVIGNPPYLEFKQIRYKLEQYKSSVSSAVHAVCIERALSLKNYNGTIGMIVPLSIISTQRMKIIQEMLELKSTTYYANFSWRPAKLFDTVNRALTIFISISNKDKPLALTYSNTYFKWTAEAREGILNCLKFTDIQVNRTDFWIPKIEVDIEKNILEKIRNKKKIVANFTGKSANKIYYRSDGGLYWKVFTHYPPAFVLNGVNGSSTRETNINVVNKDHIFPLIAALSSNTFWWWYSITSNCRHLNPYDVNSFPLDEYILNDNKMYSLGNKYSDDLQKNSKMLTRIQKQTGETQTQSFKIKHSKPIIDEIDRVLALHYGFSAEELDFILNYDIKYRMGKELENEED